MKWPVYFSTASIFFRHFRKRFTVNKKWTLAGMRHDYLVIWLSGSWIIPYCSKPYRLPAGRQPPVEVAFMARGSGKEMKEAFVWTIPNFSMIKKCLVSNIFRYHDFRWWDTYSASSQSSTFLFFFTPSKQNNLVPTDTIVSVWTSRLLCSRYCLVLANKTLCMGSCIVHTKPSNLLTDLVRLILCLLN